MELREQLEAACEKAVDTGDSAPFLVLADYLMERGDPRGQLIALHHQGKKDEAAKLIIDHGAKLRGPLASMRGLPPTIRWRLGYWDELRFEPLGSADAVLLRELFSAESARFLRALSFGGAAPPLEGARASQPFAMYDVFRRGAPIAFGPITDALRALRAPPTLRALRFEMSEHGHAPLYARFIERHSDFAFVSAWAPRLRQLRVQGREVDLGRLDLPELEALHVESETFSDALAHELSSARVPRLEQLTLDLRGYAAQVPLTLKSVAQRSQLAHLALRGNADALDIAVRSEILPRLKTLDLRWCRLHEAALTRAEGLTHLEELDLRYNGLPDGARRLAQHLCKGALFDPQA